MVQGVFLELGSCFLAKMACISPTKSRVKHRTLKIFLTFFRLYRHGLTEVTLCICHRPKLVLAMTPESARDLSHIFLFFSARLCFGPHLAAEANVNQSQKNCGAIKFGWWNVIVIVKTWPRA